jgi:hypothetical protein
VRGSYWAVATAGADALEDAGAACGTEPSWLSAGAGPGSGPLRPVWLGRTRWRGRRLSRLRTQSRSRWQRRPFDGSENVLLECRAVIEGHALRDEVRVERVGAKAVLPHGQRSVGLVALTDFHGRRPLARLVHARAVAGPPHQKR